MEKFGPDNRPRKFVIRNKAEVHPDAVLRVKRKIDSEHEERAKSAAWRSINLEKNLGEDIEKKIGNLYSISGNLMREKGYQGELRFLPLAMVDEIHSRWGKAVSSVAGMSPQLGGAIEIRDSQLNNEELRQLMFLKVLAHELYHSTATPSVTVGHGENGLIIGIDASGASYYTDSLVGSPALEEGLACQFQKKAFAETLKLFPRETVENLMSSLEMQRQVIARSEKIDEQDVDIGHIAFSRKNSLGNLEVIYTNSVDSERLVDYLSAEVPDFDRLIEDARIDRHTLPLARAIEARFGEGSYREITTATIDKAKELLEKLKSKNI